MTRFHAVSPSLWSRQLRQLSVEAKLLAAYVHTNDHRNSEGLYRLPIPYACADTGLDTETTESALSELTNAGLVEYDFEAEVILLPTALAIQTPVSAPQVKGALNALANLPDSPLIEKFLRLVEDHAPRLWEAFHDPSASVPEVFRKSLKTLSEGGVEKSRGGGGIEKESESRAAGSEAAQAEVTNPLALTPEEQSRLDACNCTEDFRCPSRDAILRDVEGRNRLVGDLLDVVTDKDRSLAERLIADLRASGRSNDDIYSGIKAMERYPESPRSVKVLTATLNRRTERLEVVG